MSDILITTELPSPESFLSLRKDTGWGDLTLAQAKQALEQSLCGISLFDGDKTIGMARVVGDAILNLYIQDVIIARDYRGHGYGRHIMTSLIKHFKDIYPANCTIGLMAAKGQAKFYEPFGFQIRPSETTDAGMTAQLDTLMKSQLAKTV